jgi:hypothetical protein
VGCDLGNICAKAERYTSEKSVNENENVEQIDERETTLTSLMTMFSVRFVVPT